MVTTSTIRILVIDDDANISAILRLQLIAQGHAVITASSGTEGLQKAQEQLPDLILLDVMLPDVDGFAVCTQLRANPLTAEVPILMLTALNDRTSRLRGIEAGADEFLTKPIDQVELRLRVQTLAHVNRYRRLIDERERAVAALTQARDAALEASRLKSEFIATVSHELRTPLIGVIGMSELLLETSLDTEQREFAQIVFESGHTLLSIVGDMLEYASLEAGSYALGTAPFNPAEVVAAAIESLRPRAHAQGLALTGTIDPDVSVLVHGDSGRLQLVLDKLLDNAIKFTPLGQISVSATLAETSAEQIALLVQVRDSGIGIAESVQHQLFHPFHQADGSDTRRYGGIGLGLAISKRVIELMSGTIGVESSPGQGATFWFQVPFQPAPDKPKAD